MHEKTTKMGFCHNHQMEYSDHPACTVWDGLNSYQNSHYDLSKDLEDGQDYDDGHRDDQ